MARRIERMVYVTRRSGFSAAHRLTIPAWSEEENNRVFGKCNNPHGHGHNYEIEVTVGGEVDPTTGMVIDLKKLAHIIDVEVIEKVDHKHLNFDVEFLRGINPTAENIAVAFWNVLEPKITEGRLVSVKVFESLHNMVEFRGVGK